MTFSIYVIDLDESTVEGTNDVELVQQFVTNDSFIVLMPQHDNYWLGSRKKIAVTELSPDEPLDPADE